MLVNISRGERVKPLLGMIILPRSPSPPLRPADQRAGMDAQIFAIAEGDLPRFDRADIAIGLLQQSLAARGQIKGEPRLAQFQRIHIDHVDISEIARRQHAAIIEAIKPRGVMALPLDRILKS